LSTGVAAVDIFFLPFGAALLVPDQHEISGTVLKSEAKIVIRDCRARARRVRAERDREAGVRPVGLPAATDPKAPRSGEGLRGEWAGAARCRDGCAVRVDVGEVRVRAVRGRLRVCRSSTTGTTVRSGYTGQFDRLSLFAAQFVLDFVYGSLIFFRWVHT
jgi:hypothetical protein